MFNRINFRQTLFVIAAVLSCNLFSFGASDFGNKVNLALRQTGDALLRAQGDSTSYIPPIQELDGSEFVLEIPLGFDYGILPEFLESALYDYHISRPYEVMVKSCETGFLVLGYNKTAVERDSVACRDRHEVPDCALIHVKFSKNEDRKTEKNFGSLAWLFIPIAGVGSFFFLKKKKQEELPAENDSSLKIGKLVFSHENMKITFESGSEAELTYRESKLLLYFAERRGEVLNREDILSAVWEDEGVIVGRSLDVFVSRLRKILAQDPSVNIKTIHGVGYRMEASNNL
ncbi:MAG: winged helix-turn-helix domain-containing protein [Flavobacteriales bacterium]|nr:winged helix-turn-helix domain-containing protein [Flavobacteriales bacterium]